MQKYIVVRIILIGLLTSPILYEIYNKWPLIAVILVACTAMRIKNNFFIIATLFSISCILSGYYYNSNIPQNPVYNALILNKKATITGSVDSVHNEQITLLTQTLCQNSQCRNFKEKIIIFTQNTKKIRNNDELTIEGKIMMPINNESYRNYLNRKGIYFMLNNARINRHIPGKNSIQRILNEIKLNVEKTILNKLSAPSNSIVIGLLTGSTEYLPESVTERFKKLGLTHILAISGYNITVIVALAERGLQFLMPQTRFLMIIPLLIIFTLFVGAEPPIVRACIMGIITLTTLRIGSKTSMHTILLLTAVCMYVYDPLIITWDVSFQLSFAATLGIIYLSPRLKKFFTFIPEKWGLRENLLITVTAQISTLPIMIMNFSEISIIAPIANFIILPIIPYIMAASALGIIISTLPLTEKIALIPTELLTKTMLSLIELLNSIPIKTYSIS